MKERVVLLITADTELTGHFRELIGTGALRLVVAGSLREAARTVAGGYCDIVFLEIGALYTDIEEFVPAKSLLSDDPPVVAFSKKGSIRHAVRAIRAGACDYLPQPPRNARHFQVVLDRSLSAERGHKQSNDGVTPLKGFLTKDHRLLSVCQVAAAVADSRAILVIEGEKGTGRSFLARKVHESSNRSLGAFVELTCGAGKHYDLARELFGTSYPSGRDGNYGHQGKLHLADGGTLLLNDIAKAPDSTLAELLRACGPEMTTRDGESRAGSNVRLIFSQGATGQGGAQKLKAALSLNDTGPVTLRIPPLRERVGDVPLLARYFANLFAAKTGGKRVRIAPRAVETLVHYPWPGNVKQLKDVIGRGVLLARDGLVTAGCLGLKRGLQPGAGKGGQGDGIEPLKLALQEPEREYIREVLRRTEWNKKRAAAELDVSRSTLYKKIRKYGLDNGGGKHNTIAAAGRPGGGFWRDTDSSTG